MNTNYQTMVKLFAVFAVILLISCNNDENIPQNHSESSEPVAGEWYMYQGISDNLQRRTYFELKRDGSYLVCKAEVTREGAVDYGSGSYTLNGKSMKLSYKMYETSKTDEYIIRSVGKYDMHLFLPSIQQEEIDYRIIETKYMKVGEIANALISDSEFIPDSYKSDDERVVEVDKGGTFHALRQGTAYILIHSSIGTAVVRVVVEADTYIENFVKYMGENIRIATNAYGVNTYYEGPFGRDDLNQRWYFLIDDLISELVFLYDQDGIINHIMLQLRYYQDVEQVKKAFYDHYLYEKEVGYLCLYSSEKTARKVQIKIDEETGIIHFYYASDYDPFAEVDNLVKKVAAMTITEFDSNYGITDEDRNQGFKIIYDVYNEVFTHMIVYFDFAKEKIIEIDLLTQDSVSMDDLDSWYGQHYIMTKEHSYMNDTPRLHVRFDQNTDFGLLVVSYYITK